MSTPEWFYANADEHVGPFSPVQMTALVRSGAVSPDALVWREGMASWVPARQEFPTRPGPPPIPRSASPLRPAPSLATPVPEVRGDPPRPAISVTERVRGYWSSVDREQKAVTVLSAFAAFVAWQTTGNALGDALWLCTLVTLAGATQFSRAPLRARSVVLFGSAATGLLALWIYSDDEIQRAVARGTEDLLRRHVEALVLVLVLASAAMAFLTWRKRRPGSGGDSAPDDDSLWASWDRAQTPREGTPAAFAPRVAPSRLGDADARAEPAESEVLEGTAHTAPAARLDAVPSPEAMDVGAGDLEGPSSHHALGAFLGEHKPSAVYKDGSLDDEQTSAWGPRAAVVVLAAAVLLLAGWAGLGAYQRSQAAQARVGALETSVGSVVGADMDAALEVGRAAVDAQGDESRLNDAFGPQGAQNVQRLAGVYAQYERATGGTLRRNVESRRAEVAQLERQAASARSGLSGFERRTFAVGRQFDTSTSGTGMYSALDMTGQRQVVLKIGSETAAQLSPGRQAVLYVQSDGEQAVTVTQSNGYGWVDKTEYYTVYRVEGSDAQVEALTRQIEADAASVRLTLSQIEAQLEATIGVARESYWAGAGPIISSLRDAD